MVNTTIAVSGTEATRVAIVSRPVPPGIPRSSTRTSGRIASVTEIARGKSPASPTTSISSSVSSRSRRPARTTAWSSASTTVIGSLITERLRGSDARRTGGRREGGQESGREDDDEHDREMSPGGREVQRALIRRLVGRVGDDVARHRQAERAPDEDRGEGDERRLEQEGELDHAALEADRAQDADLLPALDDRAGADDAQGGDADDQPEAHEAEQQPVERVRRADRLVQPIARRLRLHAAGQERALERTCRLLRVDAGCERDVVDRQRRA